MIERTLTGNRRPRPERLRRGLARGERRARRRARAGSAGLGALPWTLVLLTASVALAAAAHLGLAP
jgi:hypothetical protein